MAWPARRHEEYVRGAVAWVEFVEGRDPDALDLALHTMLLGFDDRYYSGLMRLFTLLRMGDR